MTFIGRTALALLFLFLITPVFAIEVTSSLEPLVVHEWGTFTSVASETGTPVKWAPLSGPEDLPCFVARLGPYSPKATINSSGLVRMETPVLYFYSPRPITLSVGIRFPQGWITEWYPHAAVTPTQLDSTTDLGGLESTATWPNVLIRPGDTPVYPHERGESHYYAARATDAVPVQVNGQDEKFLFYRGVGGFQPPLSAAITSDGRVHVEARQGGAVGDVLQFDNTDGHIRYRFAHSGWSRTTLDATPTEGGLPALHSRLERLLVAHGLYEREARAMVDTWKDSWFEPGVRLIYIVPASFVDATLPLDIRPRPSNIARVFVGRIELLSDAKLTSVKNALLNGDAAALNAHGRFVWPAVQRVLADSSSEERGRLERSLALVYRMPTYNLRRCSA